MFSSFSTPALSALLTFFIFIIGHSSSSLRDLTVANSGAGRIVIDAIYYLLPNFAHFSFITEASNQMTPPGAMIAAAVAYAFVYNIILLTITVVIFSRRNFK
jgi:hypothetical protein